MLLFSSGSYPTTLLPGFVSARPAQQEVDSVVGVGVGVGFELKLRYSAEVQPRGQFVAEEVLRVLQSRQRLLLLAAFNGNLDMSVAHIGRHVGNGYGNLSQTRIVHLEPDQFGQFLFDRQ